MKDGVTKGPDTGPIEGLPLRFALTYHAAYPPIIDANGEDISSHMQRVRVLKGIPSDYAFGPTDAERALAKSAERVLSEVLVSRLWAGRLNARGFLPNSVTAVDISPAWWQQATLDLEANTAEANGTKITGVLVFESSPVEQASGAPARNLDPAKTWMQRNVTRPGQWKRESAIKQCSLEAGVTTRVARTAWNALDNDLRGSRGRHK